MKCAHAFKLIIIFRHMVSETVVVLNLSIIFNLGILRDKTNVRLPETSLIFLEL